MFVDLRSLDNSTVLETDICIVGAGPAGISMARTFIGTGDAGHPCRKRRSGIQRGHTGPVRW